MARNSRFDGLMVPTMRAAQRVRNKVGLYFDRRTDTPLVQRRDGSTVELGRLNIEEQGGTAGEMLTLRPDGRYRSGPLANAHRAYTRGIIIWSDFISQKDASLDIGSWPWGNAKSASGGNIEKVVDSQASQRGKCAGVVEIRIAEGSDDGSRRSMHLGGSTTETIFAPLPDDTWCCVKARVPDVDTDLIIYALMTDQAGRWPDDIGPPFKTLRAIGAIYRTGDSAGNWEGICRNGQYASETAVDLGVAGNDTWHEFAWNYRSRGPNAGVQFYVDGVPTGSVITTNLPPDGYGLSPCIGIVGRVDEGTTVGVRSVQFDYFGFFAPCGDRW